MTKEDFQDKVLKQLQVLARAQDKMSVDVNNIQRDLSSTKQDLASVKQDSALVKQDLSSIKSGQNELFNLAKGIEHRVEENTAKLNAIDESVNYLQGIVNRIEKSYDEQKSFTENVLEKVSDVEDNVMYAVSLINEHNKDIFILKNKLSK